MREIKFRAFEIIQKRMYYNAEGGIYEDPDEIVTFDRILELSRFIVMQYTDLKDKNGREIFEGDILQTFYGKENTPLTATVYFNKEGYWDSGNLLKENPLKVCYGGFYKCEVIGNTYENPELLNA